MGLNRQMAQPVGHAPVQPHRIRAWYAAYMETLFEYDQSRIGGRVHEAEVLIRRRQQELIPGDGERPERTPRGEVMGIQGSDAQAHG